VSEERIPTLDERERHELVCLRHQVRQMAYPCSPHCEGYLREQATVNSGLREALLSSVLYEALRKIRNGADYCHCLARDPHEAKNWLAISEQARSAMALAEAQQEPQP
jgi:hypothetical protein